MYYIFISIATYLGMHTPTFIIGNGYFERLGQQLPDKCLLKVHIKTYISRSSFMASFKPFLSSVLV